VVSAVVAGGPSSPPPPSRGVGGGGANCRPLPSTWYSGGRYTPPSPQERGDGFNHHSSSNASTQQDEPCGQPRAVSPRARQAFDLYQECVAAGLCARLVLELKQGGERISFTCRPAAAATYAAVAGGQRRPAAGGQPRLVAEAAGGHRRAHNARRAARKRRWRGLKRAATDATAAVVAEAETASAAERTAPASSALITTPAGSVTPGKRDVASTPPTRARPVISPRVTRARKKRKEMSPDSDCLEQLDGEVASPPASPASWVGSLSAPTQLISVVGPVSPSATGNNVHLEPLALQFTTATAACTAGTAGAPSTHPGSPSAHTVLQSSGSPSAPSPPPSCTAGPPSTDPGSPSAPTVQQSSGSPLAPSPPPPPLGTRPLSPLNPLSPLIFCVTINGPLLLLQFNGLND
jgi:hypothetical protein